MKTFGNKKERITDSDMSVGFGEILKDGLLWFNSSSSLACIVWNNLIGANLPNKEEHEIYCRRLDITPGNYSIKDSQTNQILDRCTLTLH